ncbi:MAG: hypothetical protein ACXV8Q_02885 [Methylobacter sp.]
MKPREVTDGLSDVYEKRRRLWRKIPEIYLKQAAFHTDLHESYVDIIPQAQHLRVT